MEIHPLIDPLAPRKDSDGRYEFLKPGNSFGDNDNWGLLIIGDNFYVQVKIAGTWETTWSFPRPK